MNKLLLVNRTVGRNRLLKLSTPRLLGLQIAAHLTAQADTANHQYRSTQLIIQDETLGKGKIISSTMCEHFGNHLYSASAVCLAGCGAGGGLVILAVASSVTAWVCNVGLLCRSTEALLIQCYGCSCVSHPERRHDISGPKNLK